MQSLGKPYAAPRLKVHGSVEKITLQAATGGGPGTPTDNPGQGGATGGNAAGPACGTGGPAVFCS
jgi:hypothetical protein